MRKRAVVIGSGVAGTVLCNDLADHFDVLLLEKGPTDTYYTPSVRYEQRPLASVPTFCLGRGGTTNLWHNGLVPLRPSDLSPGTFQDVLTDSMRFMDRAAAVLHFPESSFSSVHDRLMQEMGTEARALGFDAGSVDSLVYPKRYAPLEPRGDIDAAFNVGNLRFVLDDRRVEAVEFDIDGQASRAETDVVILAAGTLGTPGVLRRLVCGLEGPAARVGSGFIDHPMGFVGKVRFGKEHAEAAEALASTDHGAFVSRSPLRLKSECGRFTGCAFLRRSMTMTNSPSIHRYKSLLGASKGLKRLRNAADPRLLHPDVLAEIVSHLFDVNAPGHVYSILFIGEQKRNGNRVYYDDDDRLVVDWSITESELLVIRHMISTLEDRLGAIAEDLVIETDIGDDWLWSCAHHSGTTALGNGDDALVNPDLRLRCSENVFVCDASVIQEHSYANTGLTIAQLALRLSHHLRTNANAL